MKKVLLMAFAAVTFGTAANAQMIENRKIDNSNEPRYKAENEIKAPTRKKPLNKGGEMVSDWYSWFDLVAQSNVGSSLNKYVAFLSHDTLNKFVADDGTINYGDWISTGHVLDPKDDLIANTTLPQNQLSKFNSYKIDSINFPYLYVRNVDSMPDGLGGKMKVVDTLFINYFAGSQIKKLFFQTTNDKLAMVDWDYSKRLPANYAYQQTIVLPSGVNPDLDTTHVSNSNGGFENGWSMKGCQFAAPAGMAVTVNANGTTTANLTGFTFTFKTPIPAVVGTDTAVMVYQKDPATAPAGMRRTNYFGYHYEVNSGSVSWDNKTFFNTSLFALSNTSYKDDGNANSWKGYISGNAWTNDRFLDANFHLTITGTIGAGINENDLVSINSIYPNPSKNGSVKMTFETKSTSDVKVEVYNLIGQNVKTLDFGRTSAGNYELPMELGNLNPGVYMVTVTAGSSKQTQKFVISE